MLRSLPIVLLPASADQDQRFGVYPPLLPEALPSAYGPIHPLHFSKQVWYNAKVRLQVWDWIQQSCNCSAPVILVGFSKSGLGALNLACERPDQVAGVVVFDAPLAAAQPHPAWQTQDWYPSLAHWQQDQPIPRCLGMDRLPPIALISGQYFHAQMLEAWQCLRTAGMPVVWRPEPEWPHRWDARWVLAGLDLLQKKTHLHEKGQGDFTIIP